MSRPKLLLLLLIFATTTCTAATPPSAEVDGEKLSGEIIAGKISVFRGVPFAEPPVGDLRWQRPQALVTKVAERDATTFAPACMQSPRILEWYRDLAETFGATRDVFDDLEVSEDCLYLNIWTPELNQDALLPVMVYIHGGSNNSGWSYEPNYHGQALAERGVVLVSIPYRLGVFGFFSHTESDVANVGWWELLAALEWIQQHIAKFGGDPNRVTVFGESSGAQDVLALMATERAQGLFHGAIMQSTAGFGLGGRRSSPTLADEQQRGVTTAALFGIAGPGALQELRSVPATELLQTYEGQPDYYYHSPAIDGRLLSDSPWDTMEKGELSNIPFIIGSNADERYASISADLDMADVPDAVNAARFLSAQAIIDTLATESDPREAIDRLGSAEGMLCPSQYLAAHQTALHGNGWVYFFSRVRDGEAGAEVRAYHGAELPYAFGTHDPWMTTTDVDWYLAGQMMRYWIQLATTGNPNAEGLPEWPAFTGTDGTVMEFADVARPGLSTEPILCGVFNDAVRLLEN
jgi:para-nitrobenzyl esterase